MKPLVGSSRGRPPSYLDSVNYAQGVDVLGLELLHNLQKFVVYVPPILETLFNIPVKQERRGVEYE